MDIHFLRKIGQTLKEVMPLFILESRGASPVGRGASGDKTYPMDKKAEDIIIKAIETSGLPATVISEEAGRYDIRGGGPRMLIDPLDGSRNANTGLPFYSTSIAIVDGDALGSTRIGYVLNLVNGDEFWAVKDGGFYFNNTRTTAVKDSEINFIFLNAQNRFDDIPKIMPVLSLCKRLRCLGSTALELALTAQGTASLFVMPSRSRTFDFAAGWLMVKEAGGIITDMEGMALDSVPIGIEKVTSLLAATNAMIHKKSMEALKNKK